MSAPWNFARFLPLAERLLSRGRLPALLFAVARKGPRIGQLREDVKLLQSLCLAWWRGEYRAISPKARSDSVVSRPTRSRRSSAAASPKS